MILSNKHEVLRIFGLEEHKVTYTGDFSRQLRSEASSGSGIQAALCVEAADVCDECRHEFPQGDERNIH